MHWDILFSTHNEPRCRSIHTQLDEWAENLPSTQSQSDTLYTAIRSTGVRPQWSGLQLTSWIHVFILVVLLVLFRLLLRHQECFVDSGLLSYHIIRDIIHHYRHITHNSRCYIACPMSLQISPISYVPWHLISSYITKGTPCQSKKVISHHRHHSSS